MQHFFVKQNQIIDNNIIIIGKDVNHIKNVLRCRKNEKIEISVFETEEKYLAEILELNNENIMCKIINRINENYESNIKINIIQGLPKSDKMELIIQKCTELGVKEITPLELERCIVKLDSKEMDKKIARWESIAETAAKQCGRNCVTKINKLYNLKNIEEILNNNDLIVLAYEDEKDVSLKDVLKELKFRNLQQELSIATLNNFKEINNKLDSKNSSFQEPNNFDGVLHKQDDDMKIAIIIGPEGGLEEKEVEKLKMFGAKSISLGKRILRTETVAIALASVIMYELGDFGEI